MARTLWSLFFDEADRTPEGVLGRIEASRHMGNLKKKAGAVEASFWASSRDAIDGGLQQLMGVSITDIVVRAWAKHRQLQKLLDAERDPNKVIPFDLGEHVITSRHKPRIELKMATQTVGALEFDLELSLALKMARLQIQDRKVMRATTGACTGEGTLKLAELELAHLETKEIDLPGALSFGNGVPLPL